MTNPFSIDTSVWTRGTYSYGLVLPPRTYLRLFRTFFCRIRWPNVPKGLGIPGAYPFHGLRLRMAFPANQYRFRDSPGAPVRREYPWRKGSDCPLGYRIYLDCSRSLNTGLVTMPLIFRQAIPKRRSVAPHSVRYFTRLMLGKYISECGATSAAFKQRHQPTLSPCKPNETPYYTKTSFEEDGKLRQSANSALIVRIAALGGHCKKAALIVPHS